MFYSTVLTSTFIGAALALRGDVFLPGQVSFFQGSPAAHYPQVFARDLELIEEDGELYIRDARGSSGHASSGHGISGASVSQGLKRFGSGASAVTNAAGNIGSFGTGIADVVGLFRGHKRDLDELYIREAKGGRPSSQSLRQFGHVASGVTDAAGNLGTFGTGIANVVGMFKGQQPHRRDLDTREAKGGKSMSQGAKSFGKGASAVANAAGNVGAFGTGVADVVGMFKGGKRDLDDEDFELFVRELELEFED